MHSKLSNFLRFYIIGSPEVFDMIQEFEVGKKVPESDHLPLVFSLTCNIDETDQSRKCLNWDTQWTYQWTQSELSNIKSALCDELSIYHHKKIEETLADLKCTNTVAAAVNSYIEQACKRSCPA